MPKATTAQQVGLADALLFESNPALKKAIAIGALLQGVIALSDSVASHQSPLDMQGKLLFLHNSIQKNKPRMVALLNEFIDTMNAAKKEDGHG